jgi:AbrB family looped-hinge helix DNA binding protein
MKDFPKIFGIVTVGERGQVVIPSEVRKSMQIKTGDKLIVFSGPPGERKIVSLIPADDFSQFLGKVEQNISAIKKSFSKKIEGK